jgi:hypothetical protein
MPNRVSCSRKNKPECKSPCTWIRGSGCKSTLKPIKQKKLKGGCSRLRKNDCKEPCTWIKNKGCSKQRKSSKSPESKSRSSGLRRNQESRPLTPQIPVLEKLIKDYAKDMSNEGLDLIVNDLFDGGLADMGYEDLAYAVNSYPETKVREIAKHIFDSFSLKK